MHRLIMNSDTYQMASADIPANVAIDRENRYLWRMPRRRLEGEAIRDSIMAVAGNLDRNGWRPGRASVYRSGALSIKFEAHVEWQARFRSIDVAAQRIRVLQAIDTATDVGRVRQAG